MDYISGKEFLNQSKEVQKVLLNWWQPNAGDLFNYKHRFYCVDYSQGTVISPLNNASINTVFNKKECIPLLTEGQLRKFIEDKTDAFMDIIIEDYKEECDELLFRIEFWNNVKTTKCWEGNSSLMLWSKDLLQAYFKVAIEIIERSF